MYCRYNAGLTLMVLYGYKATSTDDRFMKLAAESTEVLSNKLVTGGGVWAVDIFPFCASFSLSPSTWLGFSRSKRCPVRYIPSWFPGAGFKRSAVEWKKLIEDFVNEPYEDCKQKIVSYPLSPFAHMLKIPLYGTEERNSIAIFYLACVR